MGYDEAGKRDGTGSFRGGIGRRKIAGEKCPFEDIDVSMKDIKI